MFADGQTGAMGIVSGGVEHRVQLPFTEIGSIAWSPDGTRFLVTGRTKGAAVYDVYTVRTDGSGLWRLTTNIEAYGVSWR